MKKPPAFLLTLLILLAACEKKPAPQENDIPQVILRKKAAEIIKADRTFAFELFGEVMQSCEEKNLMISPLSVSYALGMTCNGAAGTTLDAFYDVLHFGDLTLQEVNESYQDLMNQLVHLDEQVEFSIANSIWYRLGFDVLTAFVQTNQTYFDAMVSQLDFSDPEAVDIINEWIEAHTNGKIQNMLDYIPGDAVMYLINAIYFNATWKYEFDKGETQPALFYPDDVSEYQTDFMKVNGNFLYASTENFSAVELPYGDSTFSMVVMLPATGLSVGSLAEQMNTATWESWFDQAQVCNVQVELPKFNYGFKSLLNDPLINLGLGVAFGPKADFSGITPGGDIFISRVIHQTFIDVQEEGTEAAAATIVEMWETAFPANPLVLCINRPFLFFIKENSTGTILFMGKVGKPLYS